MENHGEILAPTLRDSSDQNNEWISVSETWRQTSLTSALELIPPWSRFLCMIQLLGILSKKKKKPKKLTSIENHSLSLQPSFCIFCFLVEFPFPLLSWVSAMILHEKQACFPFQMCTAPNTNGKKSWRPPCCKIKSSWRGAGKQTRYAHKNLTNVTKATSKTKYKYIVKDMHNPYIVQSPHLCKKYAFFWLKI